MIDPGEFRRVLGHYPTGVTVVTGITSDGPAGMAIGSFASVSLDPPLVMFCPKRDSDTWQAIKPSGSFCANILGDDQADVCGLFASSAEDRFAGMDWTAGETGSPIIPGSIGYVDCDIESILDGGDHEIVVGRVKGLEVSGDQVPLLFFKGGYGRFESL